MWWRRMRQGLFARKQRDLDEEIRFDLEEETRLRVERGESPESAGESARRHFGNVTLVREVTRDTWGWTWLERLLQDVHFAARVLRKSPAFTLVAIASLAIGIGANTAMFSLVDAILLRSLPVRQPGQLRMVLWAGEPRLPQNHRSGQSWKLDGEFVHTPFSYSMYKLLAGSVPQFSDLIGFAHSEVTVVASGDSHYANAYFVTGNYFSVLDVGPMFGRTLSEVDDRAGAPPAVTITYPYWERRFHLDAAAVGRDIFVNGKPVTVIGVLPRSFGGIEPGRTHELYFPIALAADFGQKSYSEGEADSWWVQIVGRLRDGASTAEAQAALTAVMHNADAAFAEKGKPARDPWRPVVVSAAGGVPVLRHEATAPLLILSGVVALVLLIACANLANLLLARGTARRREIAVRLAIGAGRGRLIRQLVTESLLLAAAGAAIGFALAPPLSQVVLKMAAWKRPAGNRPAPGRPDLPVHGGSRSRNRAAVRPRAGTPGHSPGSDSRIEGWHRGRGRERHAFAHEPFAGDRASRLIHRASGRRGPVCPHSGEPVLD